MNEESSLFAHAKDFGHPDWLPILDRFASEGLLTKINANASLGPTYRLTERGTEVCDTILAELV